jgi:hypothetical protein
MDFSGDEQFRKVPIEVLIYILSHLDYNSIINACNSNSQLKQVCQDPDFWKLIVRAKYPGIHIPEGINPQNYLRSADVKVTMIVRDFCKSFHVSEPTVQSYFTNSNNDQLKGSSDTSYLTDYEVNVANLNNNQLKISLEALLATSYETVYNKVINIKKGTLEYTICTRFDNNLVDYVNDKIVINLYGDQITHTMNLLGLQNNTRVIPCVTRRQEWNSIVVFNHNYLIFLSGHGME